MKKFFKIKRLLKARNKSGFTLVEVIISCALLAILVLGIMTFVTPVLKMVSSGQKNARATMLAETVDTYISGILRTAKMVEVFENVNYECPGVANINLTSYSPSGGGLYKIDEFMRTGTHAENFEVRALGIITKNSGDVTTQGLRIYNIELQNGFADGSEVASAFNFKGTPRIAFQDLMFEGLYPVVKLETFKAQESSTGDETEHNASGYRISTKVYSDSKCYSAVSQEERDKSRLAFEGVTFFENLNFNGGSASDIITVASVQDAMEEHEAENGKLYYPATIIYYVAPKR